MGREKHLENLYLFYCILSTDNMVPLGGTSNPSWPDLKIKEIKVSGCVLDQFSITISQPLKTTNHPPTNQQKQSWVKYKML